MYMEESRNHTMGVGISLEDRGECIIGMNVGVYTTGGYNPECSLVKIAFQPVSIPQVTTDLTYDVKMSIYSVPSDCAMHSLISPAKQFINLIAAVKSM
jgi:hypothetical protein